MKDKIEITGLELEILRIVNKYGYGKLNATKNSKGEFEYDGVIEMDLKKHDSMIKKLSTLIQQEREEAIIETAADVINYFRYLPKESWQPVGGLSNIKYIPSYYVDNKILEVENKYLSQTKGGKDGR